MTAERLFNATIAIVALAAYVAIKWESAGKPRQTTEPACSCGNGSRHAQIVARLSDQSVLNAGPRQRPLQHGGIVRGLLRGNEREHYPYDYEGRST